MNQTILDEVRKVKVTVEIHATYYRPYYRRSEPVGYGE